MNDIDLTIGLIEQLAMLWGESGDIRRSARLFGASEAVRAEANLPRPPPDVAHLSRSLAKNRSKVSEDVWSSYINEGRLLSGEAAIAEGIS